MPTSQNPFSPSTRGQTNSAIMLSFILFIKLRLSYCCEIFKNINNCHLKKLITGISITTGIATISRVGELPPHCAHHHVFLKVLVCWPQSALLFVKSHTSTLKELKTVLPHHHVLFKTGMLKEKEKTGLPHLTCCQALILQKLSLRWSLDKLCGP